MRSRVSKKRQAWKMPNDSVVKPPHLSSSAQRVEGALGWQVSSFANIFEKDGGSNSKVR
jgi:hypothetical protein